MKSSFPCLLDPTVFNCFSTSSLSRICNRLKWSTVSITAALLIIIVYSTSGLYTLIDVTTLISTSSLEERNGDISLVTDSSTMTIRLRWISICVYFSIVLLIIVLLCGVQWSQPSFLFIWSILMIIMLLADGIVTILALRPNDQQLYQALPKHQILFAVMIIRLTISLCGIFLTICHFRSLSKAKTEYLDRQRMLHRYNTESTSMSHDSSWTRSGGLLIAAREISHEQQIPDLSAPPMILPRTKVATIQRHPISTLFQSRLSVPFNNESTVPTHSRPRSEYNHGFQYNVSSEEQYHQERILNEQEL